MTRYNLPDQGSQEWYSSPLYPAVADLDRRIGIGDDTDTSLAAQVAAAQADADAAQATADSAVAAAAAAQTTANAANAVKPYWFGYLATDQSTATWSALNLINWTQDSTAGGFAYSAGVLTMPALTGRYRVTAAVYFDISATTGIRLCQVYSGASGGSPIITNVAYNVVAGTQRSGCTSAVSKTLQFGAGAQIRVLASQDAGGNLLAKAGANLTYFQVEYLGAN
jgi:hypothetical protein